MFQGGAKNFPVLKGKAAEIRGLVPALAEVFPTFMDAQNPQHREVRLALQAARTMESILDEYKESYTLPRRAAESFEKAACALVQLQTSLANFFTAGTSFSTTSPLSPTICSTSGCCAST